MRFRTYCPVGSRALRSGYRPPDSGTTSLGGGVVNGVVGPEGSFTWLAPKRGDGLGLALEAFAAVGIGGKLGAEDLDRHRAVEAVSVAE